MTSGNPGPEQGPEQRPEQRPEHGVTPEAASEPNTGAAPHVEIHVSTHAPDLCPSEESLKNLAIRVMEGENVPFQRIGIILADHDLVSDLNRRYLNHDWQTDVISFRLSDETPLEGEVYVDVETADERCAEFGTTAEDEILRYTTHGLLHLAGYDDATREERERMRKLEDDYLAESPNGA